MMALLFTLLFIALIFVWLERRKPAMLVYTISMVLAFLWSLHHMSSMIGLSL